MIQPEKSTHLVNGQSYEIRTAHTDQGIVVGTYKGDKRIACYSVDYETATDFKVSTGRRALEELTKLAKGDLDDGLVK